MAWYTSTKLQQATAKSAGPALAYQLGVASQLCNMLVERHLLLCCTSLQVQPHVIEVPHAPKEAVCIHSSDCGESQPCSMPWRQRGLHWPQACPCCQCRPGRTSSGQPPSGSGGPSPTRAHQVSAPVPCRLGWHFCTPLQRTAADCNRCHLDGRRNDLVDALHCLADALAHVPDALSESVAAQHMGIEPRSAGVAYLLPPSRSSTAS